MAADFKVVNENSAQQLQKLLVSCRTVQFYQSDDGVINVVGTDDKSLIVTPVLQPQDAQVFVFESRISDVKFNVAGARVLLGDGAVESVVKLNGVWQRVPCSRLVLKKGETVKSLCLFEEGMLVSASVHDSFVIYGARDQNPSWKVVATLDCADPGSCLLWARDKSPVLYAGTSDGRLYSLGLQGQSPALMCDIRQPVVGLHCFMNRLLVLGKCGKVVHVGEESQNCRADFVPNGITGSSLVLNRLYILDFDTLYHTELSDGEKLTGEIKNSPVQSVRAFHAGSKLVTILSESGAVYQVGQSFKTAKPTSSTSVEANRVTAVLREIHSCSDRLREASSQSEQIRRELAQCSIAWDVLATGVLSKCPVRIESFADPRVPLLEHLKITVTNATRWDFLSSNWAFHITAGRHCDHFISSDWNSGATLELNHVLEMQRGDLATRVRLSLVFRSAAAHDDGALCVFPVTQLELGVLNFLEPVTAVQFQELASAKIETGSGKVTTTLGIRRTGRSGPSLWTQLLSRSWHRGYSALHPIVADSNEMLSRYGPNPIRFVIKEDGDDFGQRVHVLTMETFDRPLVHVLRLEMAVLLMSTCAAQDVRVPGQAMAHLESLRNRMNYVLQLSQWDESDLGPLMVETDMLLAKHLPIVVSSP